jgi:hypothetical protein
MQKRYNINKKMNQVNNRIMQNQCKHIDNNITDEAEGVVYIAELWPVALPSVFCDFCISAHPVNITFPCLCVTVQC